MKYSIIVPIYNAENTIKRCLDSLLNKRPGNVELILINDGSSDNSDEICREYEENNNNIVYLPKENEGVSIARNKGIKLARGEYILFVDSDDYVVDNFYELLEKINCNEDYDYVIFSYNLIKDLKITNMHIESQESTNLLNTVKIVGKLIENKKINGPVAKIYKKEIIDKYGIHFTEGAFVAEDRAFNITYAMHIDTIRLIDNSLYNCCLDTGESLTRKVRHYEEFENSFKLSNEQIENELNISTMEDEKKKIITKSLNFCRYRKLYSDSKRMTKSNVSFRERVAITKSECIKINEEKLDFPRTGFGYLIVIPVKLKMAVLINAVGTYLAR